MSKPTLRFGVSYDFRNPADSGVSDQYLYAEILEQVQWLDGIGAELVWFTEHHFVDDGYLPSWVPVAAAMASVTRQVRFGTDICLMPFNHPIRLARRVSLMNEGIEVLQRCFSGERFSYHGKRYQFEDVKITPGYVQPGGPPLWIAAMSEAGAQRAAHYNTNFLPQGVKAESYDPWVNALQNSGRNPDDYRVGIIRSILVTDDKASDWPAVRASERYRMQLYRQFFAESGEGFGREGEQVPQTWIVGDVEHCVAELKHFIKTFAITDIVSMAVPPGMRTGDMHDSLERLFTQVVPRLKLELQKDS